MRKLNLKKPPQFEIKELDDGRFEVRERVQRGRWPFAEYGWISHLITHDKRDAENCMATIAWSKPAK